MWPLHLEQKTRWNPKHAEGEKGEERDRRATSELRVGDKVNGLAWGAGENPVAVIQ